MATVLTPAPTPMMVSYANAGKVSFSDLMESHVKTSMSVTRAQMIVNKTVTTLREALSVHVMKGTYSTQMEKHALVSVSAINLL